MTSQHDAAAASEFRRDPIRGHWTVIAPERGRRPVQTASEPDAIDASVENPFLAGSEHLTPRELFAIRTPEGGWNVRVVSNRYPAVTPGIEQSTNGHKFFQTRPGQGQHEVIVECPHFETELASLTTAQITDVLIAWQSRLNSIREAGQFDYALIFKNSGAAAGASLPHSHSQLFATSLIPAQVENELVRAREFFGDRAEALQDYVIEQERAGGRVVLDESSVVAFCPFASRFGSEVWIAGNTRPNQSFHSLTAEALADIALSLRSVLGALLTLHPGTAYNLMLHTSPFSACPEPWFRWRLEICPRLAGLAGLEMATGWYLNPIPPEVAATQLRGQLSCSSNSG